MAKKTTKKAAKKAKKKAPRAKTLTKGPYVIPRAKGCELTVQLVIPRAKAGC